MKTKVSIDTNDMVTMVGQKSGSVSLTIEEFLLARSSIIASR